MIVSPLDSRAHHTNPLHFFVYVNMSVCSVGKAEVCRHCIFLGWIDAQSALSKGPAQAVLVLDHDALADRCLWNVEYFQSRSSLERG